MRTLVPFRLILLALAALASGCGGNVASGASAPLPNAVARSGARNALKIPALITLNLQNGELEYWPIRSGGGDQPHQLSAPLGVFNAYALAANGNVIVIANDSPSEIVTYDVKSKTENTTADPFGEAIDVAVGKDGTIYALNVNNVAVYHPGSSQPSELTCQYLNDDVAVAVDDESDLFVNGYGPGGFMGVVEFPAGSNTCAKVPIRKESGYAGGIGIDPKNDDLIVVDNPDLCAGGLEGIMLVYPKPYGHKLAHKKNLNANYCAGTFRLNAASTTIFVYDATISAGYPLIDQRSYPGGANEGTYQVGTFGSSGYFGGFTTIPNTLPN